MKQLLAINPKQEINFGSDSLLMPEKERPIACPICQPHVMGQKLSGAQDWEYGIAGTFSFKACPDCGLLALSPIPSLENLKTFYPQEYQPANVLFCETAFQN